MKKIFKKFAAFMLTASLLAAGSAQYVAASETGQDVLEKIFAANAIDAVLAGYENFSVNSKTFDSNGETIWEGVFIIGEDDYSYVATTEDFEVRDALRGGEGYTLQQEGPESEYLFAGEGLYEQNYKSRTEDMMWLLYFHDADEVLSNELTEDGMRVIRTSIAADEGDTKLIEAVYTVQPDSYLVESKTTICKDGDGEIVETQEAFWTYNVPESTVFDELREQVEGNGEQRTVTVVDVDDGMNYVAQVAKGMGCFIMPREGAALYMDEECTEEYSGVVDRNEDITLYMSGTQEIDSAAILERIFEVNNADAILAEQENVSTHVTEFDSDGKELLQVDTFLGKDHCSYVLTGDSYSQRLAFRDGECYSVNSEFPEETGKYLFIGTEMYEANYDYYQSYCAAIMQLYENEEVISDELNEAGLRVITSQTVVDESMEIGYEDAALLESIYRVDPDSYLLQGRTSVLRDEAGNVLVTDEVEISYDVPESTVFDELRAEITGGSEERTVTVIDVSDGQSYSVTVNKGESCLLSAPDGAVLYIDEECTEEYSGGADRNEDLTLYMKK